MNSNRQWRYPCAQIKLWNISHPFITWMLSIWENNWVILLIMLLSTTLMLIITFITINKKLWCICNNNNNSSNNNNNNNSSNKCHNKDIHKIIHYLTSKIINKITRQTNFINKIHKCNNLSIIFKIKAILIPYQCSSNTKWITKC